MRVLFQKTYRWFRLFILLAGLGLLQQNSQAAPASPVTISGEPVSSLPGVAGPGLCSSFRSPQNVQVFRNLLQINIPQSSDSAGAFYSSLNNFMDGTLAGVGAKNPIIMTIPGSFDLSSNIENALEGNMYWQGDFKKIDQPAGSPCLAANGCPFNKDFTFNVKGYVNSSTVFDEGFGHRTRGYFNVPQSWVDNEVHVGLLASPCGSVYVFNQAGIRFPLLTCNGTFSNSTTRKTVRVIFKKAGLYPIELVFANTANSFPSLELSYRFGSFVDIDSNDTSLPVGYFKTIAGFTPMPASMFFQDPTSNAATLCDQCSRSFVNSPDGAGCSAGRFCNSAALCIPCANQKNRCGLQCTLCTGPTPVCGEINNQQTCVGCMEDSDCKSGFACNKATKTCDECNDDSDCQKGTACKEHRCIACDSNSQCAGNSCNACPDRLPYCVSNPDGNPDAPRSICGACRGDTDCKPTQVCDTINELCVSERPKCATSDKCGSDCVKCPADRPYCINGAVCGNCRSDVDCGGSNFCLSGQCTPCMTDRHCGDSCRSCGGNTPFCSTAQLPKDAKCVRCQSNDECGANGLCDTVSMKCKRENSSSCASDVFCGDNGKCNLNCNDPINVPCAMDSDCGNNQYCASSNDARVGLICKSKINLPCTKHTDCGNNGYCSPTTQKCTNIRETSISCTEDTQCGEDEKCFSSNDAKVAPVCKNTTNTPCTQSTQCGNLQVCDGQSKTCKSVRSASCTAEKDCGTNGVCVNNRCGGVKSISTSCLSSADCGPTRVCDVTTKNCASISSGSASCFIDSECGDNGKCIGARANDVLGQCVNTSNTPCVNNGFCGNNQSCRNGACRNNIGTGCATDTDCGNNGFCGDSNDVKIGKICQGTTRPTQACSLANDLICGDNGKCEGGACKNPINTPCTGDNDCGNNQNCQNDVAIGGRVCKNTLNTPCQNNTQCGINGECNPVTSRCVASTNVCLINCPTGQRCSGGVCAECFASTQCGVGESCIEGKCEKKCQDSKDCSSNECCSEGACAPGRCMPGIQPSGGLCACTVTTIGDSTTSQYQLLSMGLAVVLMGLGALILRKPWRTQA